MKERKKQHRGTDNKRPSAKYYFDSEKLKFCNLTKHAHLIGNAIGKRFVDSRRGFGSWLFVRACVTAQSLEQLFDPPPSKFGDIKHLDHAGIAVLSRSLIENIAVLLYVADIAIEEEEWICRKHLIDLHDFINRTAFLKSINYQMSAKSPEKTLDFLQGRLRSNSFFVNLPAKRQARLLEGEDMFVGGRHQAMLKLGWGDTLTRGVYKYLSNQAHSLSMSFHRTEMNKLYENDSDGAKVVAAFATEFARKALGVGCLKMIELFPDTELSLDHLVIIAMKADYSLSGDLPTLP